MSKKKYQYAKAYRNQINIIELCSTINVNCRLVQLPRPIFAYSATTNPALFLSC